MICLADLGQVGILGLNIYSYIGFDIYLQWLLGFTVSHEHKDMFQSFLAPLQSPLKVQSIGMVVRRRLTRIAVDCKVPTLLGCSTIYQVNLRTSSYNQPPTAAL